MTDSVTNSVSIEKIGGYWWEILDDDGARERREQIEDWTDEAAGEDHEPTRFGLLVDWHADSPMHGICGPYRSPEKAAVGFIAPLARELTGPVRISVCTPEAI